MNICSKDHGEVCYDGENCPACEVIDDKDNEIDELKDTISEHEDTINALKSELEEKKDE